MSEEIINSSNQWDERYLQPGYVWTSEPNIFLVEFTQNLSPGTALDLGSGEGRNAIWLASMGWEVTASDFSKIGIEKTIQRANLEGVQLKTVVQDAANFKTEEPFDLVIMMYLHTEPSTRSKIFKSAFEALKPGGYILIVGHDVDNLEHGYGGPQKLEFLWSPQILSELLPGIDFEFNGKRNRPVTTDSGIKNAIDCVGWGKKL